MKFRADIEGLRAVAVAPILLFHLNPGWCPGGFIGVDIFFVISGYLITRLILADGEAFKFREFYVRRFFRLFPALVATLLATLVAAWWLLGPDEYLGLAKSTLASVFGVSNFYFWATIDYFNSSALERPLLHTWSLGVEEQFYVFWPALLWLTRRSRNLALLAFGLAVASLALVEVVRPHEPQAAFYLMPFRIFEFAIGAGVIAIEKHWSTKPQWLNEVMGWAALAAIGGCLADFNGHMAWPGIASLCPAVATAAIILVGERGGVGKILRLALFRFVGRISYALYLVHWPVITLYRTHTIVEPSLAALLCLGLATIVLGYALHALIEKPMRRSRRQPPTDASALSGRWGEQVRFYSLVCALVALFGGCAGVLATAGAPWRLDRQRVQFLDHGLSYGGDLCSTKRAECVFGDRSSTKAIYLIGDSHALNLVYGLDRLFASHGLKGIALYDHGCLFAQGTVTYVNGVVDQKCQKHVAEFYDYLAARTEPVIIAMDYLGYRDEVADEGSPLRAGMSEADYLSWLKQRLASGISRLRPGLRPVVIVKENYNTGIDLPKCLSRPGSAATGNACATTRRSDAFARTSGVDAMIDDIARQLPGVVAIDPQRQFCSSDECQTRDGNTLLFRDTNHLTKEGSAFLIDRIGKDLLAALGQRR